MTVKSHWDPSRLYVCPLKPSIFPGKKAGNKGDSLGGWYLQEESTYTSSSHRVPHPSIQIFLDIFFLETSMLILLAYVEVVLYQTYGDSLTCKKGSRCLHLQKSDKPNENIKL